MSNRGAAADAHPLGPDMETGDKSKLGKDGEPKKRRGRGKGKKKRDADGEPKPKKPRLSGAQYRKQRNFKAVLLAMEQEAARSLLGTSLEPLPLPPANGAGPNSPGENGKDGENSGEADPDHPNDRGDVMLDVEALVNETDEDAALSDPAKWPEMDDDLRGRLVTVGPVRHRATTFPKDQGGRSFSTSFYQRQLINGETLARSWLVYSSSADAGFCFCCKLYHTGRFALSGTGCRDWKHMGTILRNHEKSADHVAAYHDWKKNETRALKSLEDGLDRRAFDLERLHWRDVLARMVSLVRLLAGQHLPMRGTRDELHVPDNGHFLKLVEFLADLDPATNEHVRRISSEEMHDICVGAPFQDEVVRLLADKIKRRVTARLRASRYYSLVLDCTRDAELFERTTLTVRFVTAKEADHDDPAEVSVDEHFLGFVEPSGSGDTVEALLRELANAGVSVRDMRGQSYDHGAGARHGCDRLPPRLRALNPQAFVVPCRAHSLVAELTDAVDALPAAVSYFSLISDLFTFFAASDDRWAVLSSHSPHTMPTRHATTVRWECRTDAVEVMRYYVSSVYDALITIAEESEDASCVRSRLEAARLVHRMRDFGFLCFVPLWHELLVEMDGLSVRLWAPAEWDLCDALEALERSRQTLRDNRDEDLDFYARTMVAAGGMAAQLDLEGKFPKEQPPPVRRRKGAVSYSLSTGDGALNILHPDSSLSPERHYRVNVFERVLDAAIECVERRLAQLSDHDKLFAFLYDLTALRDAKKKEDLLKQCMVLQVALSARDGAGVCSQDVSAVELCDELKGLAKRIEGRSKPLDVLEFLCQRRLVSLFPNVYVAMRILLTLPLTAGRLPVDYAGGTPGASCKLERIKAFLGSSVGGQASVELALVAIEQEIAEELDPKEVVDEFARTKARQVNCL